MKPILMLKMYGTASNVRLFRDYHDLYNVSDALLLADIFENFRSVCLQTYKLDPVWYYIQVQA